MDLPEFWADRLKGKRICIVGNAPSMYPTQTPIDEHDVVFRFNDYVQGGEWGSRTSYYCTTMRKEVRTDPNSVRAKNIPLVNTSSNPSGACELSWKFAGVELEQSVGCWPSSGLMAAYIACACKAEHVTLAAMTLAPTLIRESSWHPRYAPPWVYHNFLGERRVLAHLLQTTTCSFDLPPGLGSLRLCTSNYPDPLWAKLASELKFISQTGGYSSPNTANLNGQLKPEVLDRLQRISKALSVTAPCMEGVRILEPYFYLSGEKRLHHERWLLFHPTGAPLMDGLLVQLRSLQAQATPQTDSLKSEPETRNRRPA